MENKTQAFVKNARIITNTLVTGILFVTIVVLLLYAGYRVYDLFLNIFEYESFEILHDIAFIIVLIKAYRVLLFYFESHHVSIKYIIELSIIAPAIEIVFAPTTHSIETRIIFMVFSIAMLTTYLLFYRRLCGMDENCNSK